MRGEPAQVICLVTPSRHLLRGSQAIRRELVLVREPGDSQPELPFGPIASGERPEAAGARILNESTHRSYRLIARLPDLGFEGLPTAVVHFEAPRNAIDWMQVSSPPVRWHFVPATDVPPRFALLMAALESAWSRRVP